GARPRDHQQRVTAAQTGGLGGAPLLAVAEMARDRPLPAIVADFGPRETHLLARSERLGNFVELAPRELKINRQPDRVYRFAARQRFSKHPERGAGETGAQVLQFESEPEVGFVAAEALHRFAVRHARKGPRDFDVESALKDRSDHALGEIHDVVGARAGHLDIDLAELGLPVGAQVLVPEASRDLVIAVEAADHEELLQELRRL